MVGCVVFLFLSHWKLHCRIYVMFWTVYHQDIDYNEYAVCGPIITITSHPMRVSFCVNLTEFISDGEMIQNTLYLLKNLEDILYRKTYEEVPLVAGRWQDIVPSEAMPDEVRDIGAQYVYGNDIDAILGDEYRIESSEDESEYEVEPGARHQAEMDRLQDGYRRVFNRRGRGRYRERVQFANDQESKYVLGCGHCNECVFKCIAH
eukprot:896859_1